MTSTDRVPHAPVILSLFAAAMVAGGLWGDPEIH